jgi:hypothetical protein
MHMKVSREQFEVRGDRIVHMPTGAVFWKGDKDIVNCDWGSAGETLDSGHDYDRDEVTKVAHEVFVLARVEDVAKGSG